MATRTGQRRSSIRAERIFFTTLAASMLALTLWGFASSFYLRAFAPPAIPSYLDPPAPPSKWLFIIHGLAFTAWMLLITFQAWLVGSKRLALHKAIGKQAYWLYFLMLGTAIPAAVYAAKYGFHVPGIDRLTFAALPFMAIALFAILAWMGLGERRDPQRHKRLMILGSAIILGAATGRILAIAPYFPPPLSLVMIYPLVLATWDFAGLGKIHPTTLKAGGAVLFVQLFSIPIGMTAPWLAAMRALIG